jgi:hypothetical protein
MPTLLRFVVVLASLLSAAVMPGRAAAYRVVVDYGLRADSTPQVVSSALTTCGITLAGFYLFFVNGGGVGIKGSGPDDDMVDGGETLLLRFGVPVRNLAFGSTRPRTTTGTGSWASTSWRRSSTTCRSASWPCTAPARWT